MTLTTRALYVISVAAELAGVHPQTLRIYERKGLHRARAHERPQPPLLRARHRAAAPHPGADATRASASSACSAILALEDELASARGSASPSSKRALDALQRGDGSAGRRLFTASTGASSSRSAPRPSCDSNAITSTKSEDRHATRPEPIHPQDPRGARRRAGAAPATPATPRSRPSTCCARCSTSPRASSPACSSASASTSPRCAAGSTRRSAASRR